jgi:hypothetical protein
MSEKNPDNRKGGDGTREPRVRTLLLLFYVRLRRNLFVWYGHKVGGLLDRAMMEIVVVLYVVL